MHFIPTTNSELFALVDDEDFNRVIKINWLVQQGGKVVVRSIHPQVPLANFIMNDENSMFDHKDRNPLNNTKINLRSVTRQQNNFNRSKQKSKTTSKFKGVAWHTASKKWRCQIQHNKIVIHLGLFTSEVEAAYKYNKEATKRFGEFANLNVI